MIRHTLILLLGLLAMLPAWAQPQAGPDTFRTPIISNSSQLNTNSSQLANTIKAPSSPQDLAQDYADLAESLLANGDYTKAGRYLEKALQQLEKTGASPLRATCLRRLAYVREQENKDKDASRLYTEAANASADSATRQMNLNDAQRISSSPMEQVNLLKQNQRLMAGNNSSVEFNNNFALSANAHLAMNDPEAAVKEFKSLPSEAMSANTFQVGNSLTEAIAENHPALALDLQQNLLEEARKGPEVDLQVSQLRQLSVLYQRMDSTEAACKALQDAFQLALSGGSLQAARTSLDSLTSFYQRQRQPQQASEAHTTFMAHLDALLARDSTLFDRELFAVNEARIAELEQQQALQEELLARRQRNAWVLGGSVALLALLIVVLLLGVRSIRRRNLKIALQSLRREMNPHFLFNSLNSVNQFIATSDELSANKFLASYSALMRSVMENSNKDHIPLGVEVEQLRRYLELEKLRFPDKFDYELVVEESLDPETVMVPNMLVQPNVENAIWHGLRYRSTPGILRVAFTASGGRVTATVQDNGIGMKESAAAKTTHQRQHQSRGLGNVRERIRLLNQLHRSHITFDLVERPSPDTGVTATLTW